VFVAKRSITVQLKRMFDTAQLFAIWPCFLIGSFHLGGVCCVALTMAIKNRPAGRSSCQSISFLLVAFLENVWCLFVGCII